PGPRHPAGSSAGWAGGWIGSGPGTTAAVGRGGGSGGRTTRTSPPPQLWDGGAPGLVTAGGGEGEILWEREAAGEAWEARLGGRWPWGDEGELAGQLLVRRAWRAGPGVLYTGQVSLAGARRLAGAWHGLGGLRWWTQWSDAGGLGGTGAELELGLSRELGSGWRLSAGWRWPLGPEPDGGGPFARVEWRPAAGSGPRPGGQDAAAALP